MKNRYTAILGWIVLAVGPVLTVTAPGPAAQAAAFDPCAAVDQGRLRSTTGTAAHLVFAISSGYSSNEVVVTECGKKDRSWRPMTVTNGRAGVNGFAEPGRKHEGDLKSPTGSFPMTEAFGVGNPGTKLPYRTLRSSGDCWGATPGRRDYNEYYSGSCRSTDEDLSAIMERGLYRQAVVIDYNRPKAVQGAGSAIFMHVPGKASTGGCISIPEAKLRDIMRNLVKGDRMIMGPKSALFRS